MSGARVVVRADGTRVVEVPLTERALALLKQEPNLRNFEQAVNRAVVSMYIEQLEKHDPSSIHNLIERMD